MIWFFRDELRFYEDLFGVEFEEIGDSGSGEYKLLLSDTGTPIIDSIKLKQIKKERLTNAVLRTTDSKPPSKKLQSYRMRLYELMVERHGKISKEGRGSTMTEWV